MTKRSASATALAGFLTAMTALVALPLIGGCGSGSHTASVGSSSLESKSKKRSSVVVTIKWPARPANGRLIPIAANSVVITLTGTTTPSKATTTEVLARPTTGNSTTYTFQNLELGAYTVGAVAEPNADGSGTPQAEITSTATVTATPTPLTLTMDATVTSLVVSPLNGALLPLRIGDSETLTATTYDASGDIVITTGAITWSSANAGVASVTPTSSGSTSYSTATVTGVSNNTTTITATYDESSNSVTPTPVGQQGTGSFGSVQVTVELAGLSTKSAWPKFHGNAGNTGQAASQTAVVTGSNSVAYPTGNQYIDLSSPAISPDGTTIYVGDESDNLYAINAATGQVKWTFPTGNYVESSPAIGMDGTVYFGSLDGILYALKDNTLASNGSGSGYTVEWEFTTPSGAPIYGSPTIDSRGVLYFATDAPDSQVYFLNSLTGEQITGTGGNAVAFSGSTAGFKTTPGLNKAQTALYIGDENGVIYSISTATGNATSSYTTNGSILYTSPAVATISGTEMVFAGSGDGHLYAFNATSLTNPLWSYNASGTIYATPTVDVTHGVVYVATYDGSSGQNDSKIVALTASSGGLIARTPGSPSAPFFTFGFTSSPALSADGSTLYIGSEDGNIYVIGTGSTGAGIATTTNVNKVTLPSGATPPLLDSSPAIGPDGKVYIGGYDGSVYVITQ